MANFQISKTFNSNYLGQKFRPFFNHISFLFIYVHNLLHNMSFPLMPFPLRPTNDGSFRKYADMKVPTLHHLTSPHHTTPHHTTPHHTTLHYTTPHRTIPHHTIPHHTTPHLTSPHLTSPHLTSPHLSPICFPIINII